MYKVSRCALLILTCVSGIACCEPYIQLAEARAATAESEACADRKITHATGFIGLKESETLAYLYKYIMSPTAERVINRYVDAFSGKDLPEDATREGHREESLRVLEHIRSNFRRPRMLFSVVEAVEGISPEREADLWITGARANCLYKWDEETGKMVSYRPAEDEGYNHCLFWLGVSGDGIVEGHLEFAIWIWDLWRDRYELVWDPASGTPPADIRVGEFRFLGEWHFQ
jgi:hypothetical protein